MPNVRMNKWTNECVNSQCANALNHCFIDNSLLIEHCSLNIAPERSEGA